MNDLNATQKIELPVRPEDQRPINTGGTTDGPAAPTARNDNNHWLTRGPAGDWYYYDGNAWIPTNPPNSVAQVAIPSQNSQAQTPGHKATLVIVLGYISAIVALFSPIFGLLGMYLGRRAKKQGDQRGRAVVKTNGACLAITFIAFVVVHMATGYYIW